MIKIWSSIDGPIIKLVDDTAQNYYTALSQCGWLQILTVSSTDNIQNGALHQSITMAVEV